MKLELLIEIAGWTGVVAYVLSYLLLSINVLKSNLYSFHLLNMAGALGLIVDAGYHRDSPNLAVNIIWLSIGLFVITKKAINSRQARNRPPAPDEA